MKPSTRFFIQESRLHPEMTFFERVHGYVYIRWTYFYIALATGRHWLVRLLSPLINLFGRWIVTNSKRRENGEQVRIEDTYHGKLVPLQAARELVSVREDISLGDVEKIIPYSKARDIILKNPQHIVALECPCRSSAENPCLPLDVCLIIGEPFASLIIEHHPARSRWISSEEAQEILAAEDDRGHVHHAFFKDAMLGRFYAICNCCSCCCGAMQAQKNGVQMLASSGYVAQVEADQCHGCGRCERICPFSAIELNHGLAGIDIETCMGCGVCVNACSFQALSLVVAEEKGPPLDIVKLMADHHARITGIDLR